MGDTIYPKEVANIGILLHLCKPLERFQKKKKLKICPNLSEFDDFITFFLKIEKIFRMFPSMLLRAFFKKQNAKNLPQKKSLTQHVFYILIFLLLNFWKIKFETAKPCFLKQLNIWSINISLGRVNNRVNMLIIDHLLMTKHSLISSSCLHHMCFILSDLKCYGRLPQALKIIFEVRRKRNNEKTTRRKISFPTYKMSFFSFSLDPFYFRTSKLSLFLFILNNFKHHRSAA
jgi:hypothetical protein